MPFLTYDRSSFEGLKTENKTKIDWKEPELHLYKQVFRHYRKGNVRSAIISIFFISLSWLVKAPNIYRFICPFNTWQRQFWRVENRKQNENRLISGRVTSKCLRTTGTGCAPRSWGSFFISLSWLVKAPNIYRFICPFNTWQRQFWRVENRKQNENRLISGWVTSKCLRNTGTGCAPRSWASFL